MNRPEGTDGRGARGRVTPPLGLVYAALLVLLVGAAAAGLVVGPGSLRDAEVRAIFLDLRATRLVAAFLVGAALAAAGVVVQGLFRNPLADGSLLGTTAGASFGGQVAVLATVLAPASTRWHSIPVEMVLPVGCVAGALAALAMVLALARRDVERIGVLLTGFVLSSLFLSLGTLATGLAQESWDLSRAVVAFTLGGLGGVGHAHVAAALPLIAAGLIAAQAWARPLDLLLSGEDEAQTLGLDVLLARRCCTIWVAALTAAAVALGGNVGFVGLVVPHAVRRFVGARHGRLLPASALAGGVFVVLCDVLARLAPGRAEMPLGGVTGLIGGPVFLVLLARARRTVEHG